MKCGLCGGTTYRYSAYGTTQEITIHNAGDLNRHKQQAHPLEYKASIQKRKDGRRAAGQARQAIFDAKIAAREAALRVVVGGWSLTDEPLSFDRLEVELTYELDKRNLLDYRYPEPVAFACYLLHKAEMEAALLEAYHKGTPIPVEDVAKAKAAMEAVGTQEAAR